MKWNLLYCKLSGKKNGSKYVSEAQSCTSLVSFLRGLLAIPRPGAFLPRMKYYGP